MPSTSIIIPTYNRPKELTDCIQSIVEQTIKPDEIIVVDDGNLQELPLKNKCELLGIRYIYHKKKTRGLTGSRNVGIRLASGDILFFLDDDTVLFSNYIEEIVRTYFFSSGAEVMGVGGVIANTKPLSLAHRLRRLSDFLFLASSPKEGKILPSGFSADYGTTGFPIKKITDVDFLSGGVSSFKKEVFESFSFSEKYKGYGMGEDKDFSFRVARKFRLVVNPRAKLYHYESPKMRFDKARETKEIAFGRYHLFNDYLRKNIWCWFLFYYALFGYLFGRTIIFCLSPKKGNWQRMKGILMAIRDIFLGKISIG